MVDGFQCGMHIQADYLHNTRAIVTRLSSYEQAKPTVILLRLAPCSNSWHGTLSHMPKLLLQNQLSMCNLWPSRLDRVLTPVVRIFLLLIV
jgi:hypothetical protein